MRWFARSTLALALLLGGNMPAWAKAGPTRGTPYDFGLLLPSQGTPFYRAIFSGAHAVNGPIDVHILLQNAYHSGRTQKMQMGSLIATRADALLVDPIDPASLASEIKHANKAGIPVVFLGHKIAGVQSIGVFPFGYQQAGRRVCAFLAGRLHGHGKIALLESELARYPTKQEAKGCREGLGKQTNVQIVARQRVQPSRDGGEQGLHELLVGHPHLDAVVAETGLMALGVARAEDRLNARIPIVMIGSGTDAEKQAIKAGKIADGVMLDSKSVGERSVKAAFHYATKGTLNQPTAATLTEIHAPGS